MRANLLILLGLLAFCAGAAGARAFHGPLPESAPAVSEPLPAPEIAMRNVWKLTIRTEIAVGGGTAFPIACERVGQLWKVTFLTAGHCIEDGAGYSVEHEDGRILGPGRALAQHPDYEPTTGTDVGLVVFIAFAPVEIRELNFEAPAWGETLLICGYPVGEGPYLTEGRASGGQRLSASAFPGSSGSPVCRPDGTVCGILVAGYGAGFQFVDFMCLQAPLSGVEAWVRLYQ